MILNFLLYSILTLPFQVVIAQTYPEYWGFQEDQLGQIGQVSRIDGEYSSDVVTFTPPSYWGLNSETHRKYFSTSIGSLGAKNFMMRSQLKVEERISENLDFKISYFDHSDFDQIQKHLNFEFTYWFNLAWGASIYSELEYRKRNDDIGLSILFKPTNEKTFRVYHTWIDFSRNDRNENSDFFTEHPVAYGAFFKSVSGQMFWKAGVHLEPTMILSNLPDNKSYKFERKNYYWIYHSGTEQDFVGFEMEHMDSFEDYEKSMDFKLSKLKFSSSHPLEESSFNLLLMGAVFYRQWELNKDPVEHLDVIPSIGVSYLPLKTSSFEYWFEGTLHSANGNTKLRSDLDEDEAINTRFNLVHVYRFSDKARLRSYFTFDLDRLSWEGGNGQFELIF